MNAPVSLTNQSRAVSALAAPYSLALARWAAAFVREELAAAKRDPHAYVAITKQKDPTPPPGSPEALRRLLMRFGMTRGVDAGNAAAGARVFRGSIVDDAIAGKEIRISWFEEWAAGAEQRADTIAADTREQIRESVRTIIAEGEAQPVKATVDQISRRIARTVHAVEPADGGDKDKVYVFSAEHAELIARTELAQVENTGRMAGYEATGVQQIEWLAYTDGRSGDRHHERMKGQRIDVGGVFTTPLGNKLRYPADPLGPIRETARCRCTIKPVRR